LISRVKISYFPKCLLTFILIESLYAKTTVKRAMTKPYDLPEVVDKDPNEIKSIIEQIKETSLPEDVKKFVIKCVELALWLPIFLQRKAISIHRLRTIIFGKGYNKQTKPDKTSPESSSTQTTQKESKKETESPNTVVPDTSSEEASSSTEPIDIANTGTESVNTMDPDEESSAESAQNSHTKKLGHGRNPHTVYQNAIDISLVLTLTVGDDCPLLCGGRLGPYKPGVIVRIKGQNFAQVYRYHLEKLRCNLCGVIISPEKPADMGTEKYDESFKALLALMKYYVAIPFHRQEQFQRMLDFPCSDATQWQLIEQLAGYCYIIFQLLKHLAANGRVIQNDDTTLRILDVIKQIKNGTIGGRTGMYTTGVVADYEGHKIALFLNGQQHSGENVSDVLKWRDPEKEPIIQMCDALSANVPKEINTILSNCLSHGFRKFDELRDYFPAECIIITRLLSRVFKFEQKTHGLSQEERLIYHQTHSQPLMDELNCYMASLLHERRVEPNSDLGAAIKYMQRHWEKLTRFLIVAGAPIDNNVVERALKIAIRHRKSSLFYRTTYSANIGGMLTSIIYTCDLAKENPHDYLISLQKHHASVLANPADWLPWNYRKTMRPQVNVANPQAHAPPLDHPVAA
jgi:transposase